MTQTPDYLARNRTAWDRWSSDYRDAGHRSWASEPSWGIWSIPESELGVLPDVRDKDALEVGCGTGYVSAWLHRRGARAVGIDNSQAQLANARAFRDEFGDPILLLQGAAEHLPFGDASFDLVLSEYGASIWADPNRWVPEAARVLRPGGDLIFLVNGTLLMLCIPDQANLPAKAALVRDYFGLHRMDWPDDESVEFHLGYGDWIRLLRRTGFEVEDLIELRAPEGARRRRSRSSRPSGRDGGRARRSGRPVAPDRRNRSPAFVFPSGRARA